MALPINIEDLLNKRKIEGNRIEFKKGWNPADIYHSICAFANDFDNLGGGYILVGVEQHDNGLAKRPVAGINIEAVDGILKQMVGFNNMFDPYYLPRTSVEEAVVNSLYHRDYAQHEPVEITIEPEGISILNCPGPDRSIPMSAIEKGDILKNRRYRNRRLGDFLKELDLTEGRSTGVPTIQEKLADNGSPRATFETTEDRLTFLIHIPIHAGCGNKPATEKTTVITTEKSAIGSEKISSGSEKSSEKNQAIISAIRLNPKVTAAEIAMKLGVSSRAVEKRIKTLRENGVIRRIGGDKGGYWEVIENGTEQ